MLNVTTKNLSGSAAADINGTVLDTSNVYQVSAQAVVTGTSTGTFKLQGSNDSPVSFDSNGHPNPTNWSDIPSATVAIAGAGVYLIPKTDICYTYTRSVFIHTNAAAGTISANLKTIGG